MYAQVKWFDTYIYILLYPNKAEREYIAFRHNIWLFHYTCILKEYIESWRYEDQNFKYFHVGHAKFKGISGHCAGEYRLVDCAGEFRLYSWLASCCLQETMNLL